MISPPKFPFRKIFPLFFLKIFFRKISPKIFCKISSVKIPSTSQVSFRPKGEKSGRLPSNSTVSFSVEVVSRQSRDTLLLTFHFFSVYCSKIFLYFIRHTMTSRTPLLDQLLAIRNLLALNDHELEQIVNLEQEQIEGLKLTAEGDPLPADALSASYEADIAKTVVQYHDHYTLRKELQRALFDQYHIDLSYRCQFKHRLTVHEALKEIADATGSSDDWGRYRLFTKDLYLWI